MLSLLFTMCLAAIHFGMDALACLQACAALLSQTCLDECKLKTLAEGRNKLQTVCQQVVQAGSTSCTFRTSNRHTTIIRVAGMGHTTEHPPTRLWASREQGKQQTGLLGRRCWHDIHAHHVLFLGKQPYFSCTAIRLELR